jgi:hypothetical protein
VYFIPSAAFLVLGIATGFWLFYFDMAIWLLVGGANSWFGINLTPTVAVVHGFRRRRIPWPQIQGVAPEPFMGGWRVVLSTNTGKRIPLRAPIIDLFGTNKRGFHNGFHTIGQWWLQHGGGTEARANLSPHTSGNHEE